MKDGDVCVSASSVKDQPGRARRQEQGAARQGQSAPVGRSAAPVT